MRQIRALAITAFAAGVAAFVALFLVGGSGAPPRLSPSGHLETDVFRGALPVSRAVRRTAAVGWCGNGAAALDRQPDVELSSQSQVHVVYAVPSDGTDQLAAYAPRIAGDIAAIEGWWRGQDSSRTVRFDRFAFPGCKEKFDDLDIGFLRLPREGAYYETDDGAERLIADLAALGPLTTYKNIVYYDGPAVLSPFLCGAAWVPSSDVTTRGGLFGLSFVNMRSVCAFDIGYGGLAASVATHELIHVLGALTVPGAPNECSTEEEQGHVCDSASDILYPYASDDSKLPNQLLDVNRDDYYGHSSSVVDVQDSLWLSRLPQFALDINIRTRGNAGGEVRITQPGVLSCRQSCATSLDSGVQVAASAQTSAGSRFKGWTGACSGTNACTLTMDAPKALTADFGQSSYLVSVEVRGKGKVTSVPARLRCSARCSASFAADKTVRLQALPAKGQLFVGWGGACRGAGWCAVEIDRDRIVRATFRAVPKKGR